jgi:hypothetical protein
MCHARRDMTNVMEAGRVYVPISSGGPEATRSVMPTIEASLRQFALILCLIWGVFLALSPQPSAATEASHGAMAATADCPDCPGCPERQEGHAMLPACAAAGALCGTHAGCAMPASFVTAVSAAFPSPLAGFLAAPPAGLGTKPQRALVPEPPPPRA